jgi:adenosylcobinamide-phosphate synthase
MNARERIAVLVGALAVDLVAGEPPARLHPVVWSGWLIERIAGRPTGEPRDLIRGTLAVALPGSLAWLAARAIERLRWRTARVALGIAALTCLVSVRALLDAAARVETRLRADDLAGARHELAWLVSQPRDGLDEAHVASGAIESLAENLSDSLVAPALAYAVGGLPAAALYRVVNTADAMVGYHGETEFLGKTAARIDDALNLVPARATAVAIALSAPAAGGSVPASWRTAVALAPATASPNAGWPMAAAAGALDLRLEKPGVYRLGSGRWPAPPDIGRARRLVSAAAALSVAATVVLLRARHS